MTDSQKQQIRAYLCGPRDYSEGVELYRTYGLNNMYKRRFTLEETSFTRELLTEELRKLAGISAAEFRALPRLACSAAMSAGPSSEPVPQGPEPMPEKIKKIVKLRERFHFLKDPDCPDELKILVNDMITAYDTYREAHARLQTLPDADFQNAFPEAAAVVEAYLDNRQIWEELEYYKANGCMLGKAERLKNLRLAQDYSTLSDLELLRKYNSAKTQLSKQRKAFRVAEKAGRDTATAAEAVAKWTATHQLLEAELDNRKKK